MIYKYGTEFQRSYEPLEIVTISYSSKDCLNSVPFETYQTKVTLNSATNFCFKICIIQCITLNLSDTLAQKIIPFSTDISISLRLDFNEIFFELKDNIVLGDWRENLSGLIRSQYLKVLGRTPLDKIAKKKFALSPFTHWEVPFHFSI